MEPCNHPERRVWVCGGEAPQTIGCYLLHRKHTHFRCALCGVESVYPYGGYVGFGPEYNGHQDKEQPHGTM